MKTYSSLFIALIIVSTSLVFGQESKDNQQPGTLVLSQNMVPMGDVFKVNKIVDSVFAPILNGLADEGKIIGWGQLNHAWGDEWNINFYYIAKDMDSFHKFWSEYVKKVEEKHPGVFGSTVKYFQAHKDNIYSIRHIYRGK